MGPDSLFTAENTKNAESGRGGMRGEELRRNILGFMYAEHRIFTE
jgi:hypothetical protein